MKMSNGVYDKLKRVITVIVPAFIALYTALAAAWGWDNTEAVVATIAAVTTFAGVCLNISSNKYGGDESE